MERIQPLERAILRVALVEMLHPDAAPGDAPIPPEGAIEEAVESAKIFCGATRPAFVNGILAAVLREVRENARDPHDRRREERCRIDELIARLERAASSCVQASSPPTRRRRSWRSARRSPPRRARSSSAAPRAEPPAARRPARTRCCSGRGSTPSAAYPDHLRVEIERYLEQMRFSEEPLTAGPGGGDALLAARGGQADPPGARARDAHARSAWITARCCRSPARSS